MSSDEDEVPAQVVDFADYRASIGDLAQLLAEVRKLSATDETVKTYADLLIKLGNHSVEQFVRMSGELHRGSEREQALVRIILEMQANQQAQNIERIKVETQARTREKGVEKVTEIVKSVVEVVGSKVDPSVLNDLINSVARKFQSEE